MLLELSSCFKTCFCWFSGLDKTPSKASQIPTAAKQAPQAAPLGPTAAAAVAGAAALPPMAKAPKSSPVAATDRPQADAQEPAGNGKGASEPFRITAVMESMQVRTCGAPNPVPMMDYLLLLALVFWPWSHLGSILRSLGGASV
jgi:hypothetical protein